MPTEALLSIIIAVLALVFTALSFRRTQSQDTAESAAERATMSADIRYIRSSIDDIKLDNKAVKKDVSELKTKVVELEASTKSAHKRLDDLIKGGN